MGDRRALGGIAVHAIHTALRSPLSSTAANRQDSYRKYQSVAIVSILQSDVGTNRCWTERVASWTIRDCRGFPGRCAVCTLSTSVSIAGHVLSVPNETH